MKVLVVHPGPHFSVADVHNGVVKGLRQNGCEVVSFNLDDRLNFYGAAHVERNGEFVKAFSKEAAAVMASKGVEVACYEMWPDVVIIMSGWFIPPDVWRVLRRRPHHVVYWATESPYEDDRQAKPAQFADTVILNDPANLDEYRANVNPNTHYLPHSFDPDVHHPGPAVPGLACDFGFVGTGFPSRLDFFEAVDWTDINAKFGGAWQQALPDSPLLPFLVHGQEDCIDNAVAADLYRSAKVSANLYRKEHTPDADADGWAMGPREVELAACGTFFLREPRPEGDELFPMLPTFTDPGEFGDMVRFYVANESTRLRLARQAHEAIADRSFQATTARLLRLIETSSRAAA